MLLPLASPSFPLVVLDQLIACLDPVSKLYLGSTCRHLRNQVARPIRCTEMGEKWVSLLDEVHTLTKDVVQVKTIMFNSEKLVGLQAAAIGCGGMREEDSLRHRLILRIARR